MDRPKQRKNREVENLINMDFGPGKTPFAVCVRGKISCNSLKFKTTSADLYTENVLTSRERIQSHVSSGCKSFFELFRLFYSNLDDGRHSRASVSSTNSRQQTLNTRRSTHRQTSSSNLSPPATKRPRRDAQRNASYKNSALFDEEDDEMDIDEERPTIETPVNTCLYCKKPARDPKLPQYCNEVNKNSNKTPFVSFLGMQAQIQEKATIGTSNQQISKHLKCLNSILQVRTWHLEYNTRKHCWTTTFIRQLCVSVSNHQTPIADSRSGNHFL